MSVIESVDPATFHPSDFWTWILTTHSVIMVLFSLSLFIMSTSGINTLAMQADSKIGVGFFRNGNSDSAFALVRYMPNGKLDSKFGTEGIVISQVSPYSSPLS